MKLNFRKIASVLTSAVMLSSTIGLAAAANYPAPFVKGGSADVAVVWGSAAASTDLVAVTDITSDLQAQLASQTATSGGSSSVSVSGGDYIVLDRPSSKIQLNQGVSDVFGRAVTNDDLPTLLEDGTYMDSDNDEHDYTQKIDVMNLTLSQFKDSDYKENTPSMGFKVTSGSALLNYTVDFTDDPSWTKLTSTDVSLMGKSYRILSSDNSTRTLTLLDSANTVILAEGETKTVTAGDKTYEVSISFITTDSAKLVVNGETTNSLRDAQTQKLKDGSYIGVKEVLANNYAGGTKQVEFSIGSGKLVLEDGQEVQMNENSVSGLESFVTSTTTGNKLDKFGITWKADGDQFIAPESSPMIPGFESLKFSFAGMTYPGSETVTVVSDGDSAIKLTLPLRNGDVTLPILAINDSGNYTIIGKDSSTMLETSSTSSLTFNATDSANVFPVSWVSGKEAESYIFKAKNFKNDSGTMYVTFTNVITGEDMEKSTGQTLTPGNVVLTVGTIDKNAKTVALTAGTGVNFNRLFTKSGLEIQLPYTNTTAINLLNATPYTATGVVANATAQGLIGGSAGTGVLQWNQVITFNNSAASNTSATTTVTGGYDPASYNLQFYEEDKDGNIDRTGGAFNLTLATTGTTTLKTTVSTVQIAGAKSNADQTSSGSDLYLSTVYSALATSIQHDKGPDQHTATITYHTGESYGELVLAAPGAEVTGSAAPVATTGVKKLGSVAVSDAEAASVSTKNLIVVGGSCVNSVAAELLGGALCGANFEAKTTAGAGSFVIQTFSRSSGKVATLVAGYNAADTSNAAKYLTTQAVDTSAGKTYVGTSATSAKLMTATTTSTTTTTTAASTNATNRTA